MNRQFDGGVAIYDATSIDCEQWVKKGAGCGCSSSLSGARSSLDSVGEVRTCAVDGCGKPVKGRGYCAAHYFRLMNTGDVQAEKPLREFHNSDTCAVEGCEKPPAAKGYCQAHYKRWKAHGDPLGARAYPKRKKCRVDGCELPAQARGLCKAHWEKERRHGDPLWEPAVKPKPRSGTCEIPGCGRPVSAIGMCTRHVHSYYTYGNPLVSRRKRRFADEIETVCSLVGCDLPHKSGGYCNKHYVSVVREGFKRRGRRHEILERFMRRLYESPCAWCGAIGDIHADHVIPLARGGGHCEGNLQPLCGECNRRKSDRLMVEWKWAMRRDAMLSPDADRRHQPAPPGRDPRQNRRGAGPDA